MPKVRTATDHVIAEDEQYTPKVAGGDDGGSEFEPTVGSDAA